ncbi:MAG: hypothetical protein A2391_03725 [Candidatus Brennerbacteria bacterium RIFOXYB1_FULL_41_13]|nr:MAG: hypothetical protein A2391_03725 [Candidatus Brennerbacteria bacterium RIFOXYB1_FULL_41_13]
MENKLERERKIGWIINILKSEDNFSISEREKPGAINKANFSEKKKTIKADRPKNKIKIEKILEINDQTSSLPFLIALAKTGIKELDKLEKTRKP